MLETSANENWILKKKLLWISRDLHLKYMRSNAVINTAKAMFHSQFRCCHQKFLLKILFIRTFFDYDQHKTPLKPSTRKKVVGTSRNNSTNKVQNLRLGLTLIRFNFVVQLAWLHKIISSECINFCHSSRSFSISACLNAIFIVYWQHVLSFSLMRFIETFLFFIQSKESMSDPPHLKFTLWLDIINQQNQIWNQCISLMFSI